MTNGSVEALMDGRELSTVALKGRTESSTAERKTTSFILLPEIVTIILLCLEARDVCSLSSCSKVLHGVCNSDYVWRELYRRRWPQQFISSMELLEALESCRDDVIHGTQSSGCTSFPSVHSQGWKAQYITSHMEMASKISDLLAFNYTWRMRNYLAVSQFSYAVNCLTSMKLTFEDVCSVLFSTKQSVITNLIGLQYSIIILGLENKDVKEAVVSRGLAEREVCLKWLTRRKNLDPLHVEQRCYLTTSIGKIAMDKEVLEFLRWGITTDFHDLLIGTLPDLGMKQTT
ncbi:F-box-like protein [Rhynchospora pubera]|uniref:F-box-like protein n=1 Tax=Rhynchospora pubera TaxID=906938 RepID=A0AAV8FJG7_9POAL|nr:F-box-like protein [Rhynchospora pubera]